MKKSQVWVPAYPWSHTRVPQNKNYTQHNTQHKSTLHCSGPHTTPPTMLLVLLGTCALVARGAPARPHLISILQDDLGWYDSGMYNPAAVAYSGNISALARVRLVLMHSKHTSLLCGGGSVVVWCRGVDGGVRSRRTIRCSTYVDTCSFAMLRRRASC